VTRRGPTHRRGPAPPARQPARHSATGAHTATLAGPTLRAFRPVAPRVAPALTAIERATPQVEGLLRDLGGLTPVARASLPAAASLVSALSPFMTAMEPTARQIVPVIQYVAAYRRELVAATANVSAIAQGRSPGTEGRPTTYFRCRTAGPSETPAPPCRQQPGWSFAGGRPAYSQRLGDRPLLPGSLRRLGALAGFGG
jgi:hypothetical protein